MKLAQLKPIAQQIRAAREAKGLSQRALADRVGIPQGHISRIENAAVDLQASSLIQIARALDLELVLISRTMLPVIEALRRPLPTDETPAAVSSRTRLESVRAEVKRVARKFPGTAVLTRLLQTILELRELPLALPTQSSRELWATIDEIARVMRELSSRRPATALSPALRKEVEALELRLRNIRNAIVHGQAPLMVSQTPAYALDEALGDGERDDG